MKFSIFILLSIIIAISPLKQIIHNDFNNRLIPVINYNPPNKYDNPFKNNNYQIVDLTQNSVKEKSDDDTNEMYRKIKRMLKQIKEEKKDIQNEKKKIYKIKDKILNRDEHKIKKKEESFIKDSTLSFIEHYINKISISNKLVYYNDTFYTKDIIQKDETLITIPFSLTISPKGNSLCDRIRTYFPLNQTIDQICISVKLMTILSKKKQSYFSLYYSQLLKLKHFYKKFPIFFNNNPRIKKLMKYTNFNNEINSLQSQIENEYDTLIKNKILPMLSPKVTLVNYMKIRMYVLSKSIQVETDKSPMPILVPLIDKIHHSKNILSHKDNIYFSFTSINNEDYIILKASRDIAQHEQLFFRLINYSNKNLLLQTGSVIKGNNILSDTILSIKTVSANSTNSTIEISLNGKLKLNRVLRQIRPLISDNHAINYTEPYNIDLEINSLRLLKKILKTTIKNYRTNYYSDVVMLKYNNELSQRERRVLTVVVEEKKIMNEYYKMVKVFYKMLKNIKESHKTDQTLIRKIVSKKTSKEYFIKLKKVISNLMGYNQNTSPTVDNNTIKQITITNNLPSLNNNTITPIPFVQQMNNSNIPQLNQTVNIITPSPININNQPSMTQIPNNNIINEIPQQGEIAEEEYEDFDD